MAKKAKKKWYNSPLFLTIIGLIGGAILSFVATYYFSIREEKLETSKIRTSIGNANQLLEEGMPQDALVKYQELLVLISKEKRPQLYAEIKRGEGLSYYYLAFDSNSEDYFRKAVAYITEAATIFTIDKYPEEYAKTNGYLANAFLAVSEIRDKENYLKSAIAAN